MLLKWPYKLLYELKMTKFKKVLATAVCPKKRKVDNLLIIGWQLVDNRMTIGWQLTPSTTWSWSWSCPPGAARPEQPQGHVHQDRGQAQEGWVSEVGCSGERRNCSVLLCPLPGGSIVSASGVRSLIYQGSINPYSSGRLDWAAIH